MDRKRLRWSVVTSLAIAFALGLTGCAQQQLNREATPRPTDDHSSERLFQKMLRSSERPYSERLQAARSLPEAPDSTPWVVLILLDRRVIYDGELDATGVEILEEADLPLVACLIESLPRTRNVPILWALTHLLSEHRTGRYSEELVESSGDITQVEYVTRPIRILALSHLADVTKVNLGFDAAGWREWLRQTRPE